MKKVIAQLFSLILVSSMLIAPANCFAAESKSDDTKILTTTTVRIDDKMIEVPMSIDVKSLYTTETKTSSDSKINSDTKASNDSCTVYIPYTEEAKENNDKVISDIKAAKGSSESFTSQYGYIYFTSTLNYSRTYYNGNYSQPLVDLISFKLEREIITSAPFDGFRNASAKAQQIGTIGDSGNASELYGQTLSFSSINYGQLYSVPSSWQPIIANVLDYYKGVKYSIPLIYSNGTTSTLTYTHEMH